MLKNVHLKNIALIEEADIDFESGLNIMTGETGSGKSIIIGAVNIALGGKADKGMIRKGADHALIELLFCGINDKVLEALELNELETDGRNLLITRKITPDASISKVNGQNVTLNTLKQITALLIDVHGQHDHQSLLDSSRHIMILDDFGKEEVAGTKQLLLDEHNYYRKLRTLYRQYNKSPEDVEHDKSLAEFEYKEIEDAALLENEDTKLEKEYKRLSDAHNVISILNQAASLFGDSENSVQSKTSEAVYYVTNAAEVDPSVEKLKSVIMDLDSVAKDAAHEFSSYMEGISFDKERYDEVGKRLDLINRLKAKYGSTLDKIFEYQAELKKKLDGNEAYFADKKELEEKINESGIKLNRLSAELSEKRKHVAERLEKMIAENLKELNFLSSDFKISFEKNERITENGFDRVEFLISTNPGEDLKPLAKVASGGEISRVMLALKSAVAQNDETDTLIFDEIDTGISGKTAHMAARKMYELSEKYQIIAITHLPQIASMADHHFRIKKESDGTNTISGIDRLDYDESIKEIAKLVGGEGISPAALENARDLKGKADFFKHKLS